MVIQVILMSNESPVAFSAFETETVIGALARARDAFYAKRGILLEEWLNSRSSNSIHIHKVDEIESIQL